jgi:hypothetical protein
MVQIQTIMVPMAEGGASHHRAGCLGGQEKKRSGEGTLARTKCDPASDRAERKRRSPRRSDIAPHAAMMAGRRGIRRDRWRGRMPAGRSLCRQGKTPVPRKAGSTTAHSHCPARRAPVARRADQQEIESREGGSDSRSRSSFLPVEKRFGHRPIWLARNAEQIEAQDAEASLMPRVPGAGSAG